MNFYKRVLLTALFFSLITLTVNAQFFEDFEDGEKSGYALGSVSLSTGSWILDDALLGNLTNDKFNGSQSVRMDRRNDRTGNVYMDFDKPNGANEVSFFLAHYGNNAEDAALQVQYSTDGGSNWINVGDEITAPATLTEYTIPVEVEGNIRFKFIQSGGTDRMNIDDISISDFVEAAAEPTINVLVDNATANNSDAINFGSTLEGTTIDKTVEIKNTGNPDLNISEVSVTGQGFSVSDLQDSTLAFNETTEVTLTFEPTGDGQFQGNFTITSNADNASSFSLTLGGEGFADGDVIPIVDARKLELGTRVTVAGRVTVANEFGGPLYMQDETAGIAVFWAPLHENVSIGDSVQVSGPLTVFKPIPGADEDFLLQISDTEEDDNIVFEVFDVDSRIPEPKVITLQQLNSKSIEGQFVVVQNVSIDHSGAFQANTNYEISDGIGMAELRIDNNTNLVGANAPAEPTNISGVVGQFGGTFQLLPRFTEDVGVEEVTFPGDEVSKGQTLDVVTWNIEWFGDPGNGPTDDDVQLRNAVTVIERIDADIYALQEISSPSRFNELLDSLDGAYGGFLASYSQTQETAFIFKRATIDSLDSRTLSSSDGFTQSDWANGRYPLFFHFNADINGEMQEIYAFNIHAKATVNSPSSDYNQRLNASAELKEYLDRNFNDKNVLFLGDYNDEIIQSLVNDNTSPYKNFDDDSEYTIVTKSLEEDGFTSRSSSSMIDHITFTSELSDEYFSGTERVENPFYVGSFLSETSDHYPVWTRFKFGMITSNEGDGELPNAVTLNQNYPNPFNPSTVISYNLNSATNVNLTVYDITGRKVSTLVNGRQTAGEQSITFDASALASGIYIYRLQTSDGALMTRKMVLVK